MYHDADFRDLIGPEDLMPPEASGGNKALFAVIGKMLLGYGRKRTAEDPS
jgi:hypothetical protein